MFPFKGWSQKGERCYHKSNKGGRCNYTGSFLVSSGRIVHWHLSKKDLNVNGMISFLNELDPSCLRDKIWVMDNLKVHHNKDVKEKLNELGVECHWLPPYSLELNPIEEMFSWLKRELRYKVVKTEAELRDYLSEKVEEIK